MFTRKTVLDETHIRKFTDVCKSIAKIDASRIHCNSMCQPNPIGLDKRNEFDADMQRFKPRRNKSRNFEKTVVSYSQRMRPDCRIENIFTTGTQKKIHCFIAVGFSGYCNTVLQAIGCFCHYCAFQEARPVLTQEDI